MLWLPLRESVCATGAMAALDEPSAAMGADVCVAPECDCCATIYSKQPVMSGKTYHVGVTNVEDLAPRSSTFKGGFFIFYFYAHIQHCFICRPLDSTVSEDAGSNPGRLRH